MPKTSARTIRMKRVLTAAVLAVLVLVIGAAGISIYIGNSLIKPERVPVTESPPSEMTYQEAEFESKIDNTKLTGWLFSPDAQNDKNTTVIFAHGYGQNRLQGNIGLELAEILSREGYAVLLFDFRNSGESAGDMTTIGKLEKWDILGAVDFIVSEKETENIFLLGFSMGGAAAILAGAEDPSIDGVIADSPFAHLPSYLDNNLSYWSGLPEFPFNRIILTIMPSMTGIDLQEVSPMNRAKELDIPLLLIHGMKDEVVFWENSLKIAEHTPGHLVKLEVIENAGHVDGFNIDRENYLELILEFLEQ